MSFYNFNLQMHFKISSAASKNNLASALIWWYADGFEQECSNSIANAL